MERDTAAVFKELLSRLQKELLKKKGFKKNGSNFRQYLPDGTCKIINFQKSLYNSDGECAFTINLGLYFQKDQEKPNLHFKEYECIVRTRVSAISTKYTGDKWWNITEITDPDQLYSELCMLMTEDILPWLDQFASRSDVIRAGQAGKLKQMLWGSLYA